MHTQAENGVVDVAGLTKVYRDFWHRPKVKAVDDLSFHVNAGDVFGLLGPNGSGKSTTIKVLLGLLAPTAGHVRVLGQSPRHVQAKAGIGYLPEESYLHRFLTARETLEFYGRLFDLGRKARRERIEALLEMVGLTANADRPIAEFSKGMMRRVGLAQALINDPELLILDEPTSGLDPIGRRQVKDLIVSLAARGKTILLSSHLLAEVEDVCTRISILYHGRLQAEGVVDELLAEDERVHLSIPTLKKETLDTLLHQLREAAGHDVTAEPARKSLERFFLDVIERAHRSQNDATGAAQFSGLAEFLSGSGRDGGDAS